MPNKCWIVIWMAYREKMLVTDLPQPKLPPEWDDLRKWAKQYIKRHSHYTKSNPYYTLSNVPTNHLSDITHCIDDPDNPSHWPHDSLRPITLPDRAATIMALTKQLPIIATLP